MFLIQKTILKFIKVQSKQHTVLKYCFVGIYPTKLDKLSYGALSSQAHLLNYATISDKLQNFVNRLI